MISASRSRHPAGQAAHRVRFPGAPLSSRSTVQSCVALAALLQTSVWAADLQSVLDMPLSPAAVALLHEFSTHPAAQERWAEALRDPRPQVRAAAARMINVSRVASRVPDLRAALRSETDAETVREEIRALVYLGGGGEAALALDTARRFSPAVEHAAWLSLAASLGPDALAMYFAEPSAQESARQVEGAAEISRLATRGSAEALSRAAAAAVERSDVFALTGITSAARRSSAALDAAVLISGLSHPQDGIGALAAGELLIQRAGRAPPNPGAILSALDGIHPRQAADPVSTEAAFLRELLRRAVGGKPTKDDAWIDWLRSTENSVTFDYLGAASIAPHLSRAERRAVLHRLRRKARNPSNPMAREVFKDIASTLRRGRMQGRHGANSPPRFPVPDVNLPELAGELPRGLASDLLAATGCSVAEPGFLIPVDVVFDNLGRAKVERFGAWGWAGAGCVVAGGILAEVALRRERKLSDPHSSRRIWLMLNGDRFACLDDAPAWPAPAHPAAPLEPVALPDLPSAPPGPGEPLPSGVEPLYFTPDVTPPTLVRRLAPHYPESARFRRQQGRVIAEIVVDRGGCVEDLSILRGKEPFMTSAAHAILNWRYRPAMLDGRPVRVYITVVVDFKLK